MAAALKAEASVREVHFFQAPAGGTIVFNSFSLWHVQGKMVVVFIFVFESLYSFENTYKCYEIQELLSEST